MRTELHKIRYVWLAPIKTAYLAGIVVNGGVLAAIEQHGCDVAARLGHP